MEFVGESEKGEVYVASYIYDNLMIGEVEAINYAIAAFKENGIVLKIVDGLQHLLSCEMKCSVDKKSAWLGQPHLIVNLVKKLANE